MFRGQGQWKHTIAAYLLLLQLWNVLLNVQDLLFGVVLDVNVGEASIPQQLWR